MLSYTSEYQALFSYLRSLDFHFLDNWVIECVNYYKSTKPNITLEALKSEVKQQWLLVDLRKMKKPSLPPDLTSKNKIILQGKYAVQVETMLDCSESCYAQYQKLSKVCNENIEATKEPKDWDIKSSRCLVFKLCDGVQEVKAMEYRPIKKIRSNDPELLPGFKMVIIGPVECRKGMILLKEENVRICGGEVDTLTTSNCLKSLLIQKLDLTDSDIPDNFLNSDIDDKIEADVLPSGQSYSENCDDQNVASLLSQNDDLFLSVSLEPDVLEGATQHKQSQSERNFNSVNSETPMDVSYEIENNSEDIFLNDVFDDIITGVNKKHGLPEEEMHSSSKKKISLDSEVIEVNPIPAQKIPTTTKSTVEEIIIDDDKFQFKKFNESSVNTSKVKPVQTKLSSFFKSSNVPKSTASGSAMRTLSEKSKEPVIISGNPFVYLKQIVSVNLTSPTVFTIKAIILTLTKKITIEKGEFNLRVNISDGSLCLDVDFCSEILESLLGFSPCEIIAMMKARQTNTAIAERIKESFKGAQEKLITLNCLMQIKFFPDKTTPIVVALEEVTAEHLNALKKRQLLEINENCTGKLT